ncbi:MAG: lysylphosphatidylglycerol synthase transmembrane domain-containing protein [Phycisphaeraceae bacterium]
MKKHLSLILRILFAAAGIAYIAVNLTWSDHVVVPSQTADGQVIQHKLVDGGTVSLDKPEDWLVVEGDLLGGVGNLTIQSQAGKTKIVTRDDIGPALSNFRAKPGVTATLTHAKFGLLLIGLLIVGPIYIIQSYRWWLLMRARGLECTVWQSFRLTMVGSFFNYCMPGTTGGDLVKAYYAAKNSARRADSVMTVVFDRITGLIGLIIMAGVAGLFMLLSTSAGWLELSGEQSTVVNQVTMYIWLGLGAGFIGAIIYFSTRIRKMLGISGKLFSKLPGYSLLQKLDEAALAYKKHIGTVIAAVLMSLPVHVTLAGATAIAGYALGMESPLGLLMTVVPVLFLAAAVPLTYQGLGVMEGLAMVLIMGAGATENQIIGMLLMIRFYQIFYSLLGSLFLLRGDIHMHPERDEEQEDQAKDATAMAADEDAASDHTSDSAKAAMVS